MVAPWALVPILDLSEIGPDGGFAGPIYYFTFGIFGMVVVYWFIKVGAPFILRAIAPRRQQPLDKSGAPPVRPSVSEANAATL